MKRSRWPIAIAVLACSHIAAAQSKPALQLSLAQAVERAIAQNPEVQIADLEAAESQEDRKIARSTLLPQASLNASESIRRLNVETLIGHELPMFGQISGPFQAMAAGPSFFVPIFDLGLWKRYRAAKERVGASHADDQTRREEISLLVVSQYLGVLRATANVDASKSRIELAQALLDQARALHKAGVATQVDEVRAGVRLRQEQQRLIVAQTDAQTALYALDRLLNLPPEQEIQATGTKRFFETSDIPPAATIETAIRNRPELASAEFSEHAAEAERSAAKAASLPSIRFQGTWEEAGRNLPGMIPTYEYEAAISIPLFTGGRISAEKRRAQIQVKRAAQAELDVRNRITEQVKSSIAEWRAARNEVNVANDALRLAQQELNLARGRFAAGVTDNIEVISAQDSLARASDNRIDAFYRFSAARATLARATGRVEETFGRSK
ncbi:MAG TPA: TolC family protein [Bryobacteraceae bacterium]|jgi:outer membrane protein TolC